jgi:glycerol uptake facilitator-like aquaporin
MELYGNFGAAGVVAGFLVIGAVLAVLDRTAARHLRTGNDPLFVLSFLLGMSLLQVADAFVNVALTMGEAVAIFAAIKIVRSGRLARTVGGAGRSRSAEDTGPGQARGLPEP